MLKKALLFLIVFFMPCVSNAGPVITAIRISENDGHSRLVIELTSAPVYKLFTLTAPPRIVIDLQNASWDEKTNLPNETKVIKNIRHSKNTPDNLRLVLDLVGPQIVQKDFILPPSGDKPYRLVLDIGSDGKDRKEEQAAEHGMKEAVGGNTGFVPTPQMKERPKPRIVIDAGHGGHDPGTIGHRGTQEKDVTLAYAKELQATLLDTGRYDVYMVRNLDVFVELRDRVKRGRKADGDLFISIHANAHENRKTQGLSIYTLSETASDKEAAALASKENKSGLINGIDLEQQEDELTALLIDMVQRETKNLSASFAENIVYSAKNTAKILPNPHRFAGFRVLTGADIPSVLIELGYLSNKKEEKMLKSEKYKKELAKAFAKAIDSHFDKYPLE